MDCVAIPILPGQIARFDREEVHPLWSPIETSDRTNIDTILTCASARARKDIQTELAQEVREDRVEFAALPQGR